MIGSNFSEQRKSLQLVESRYTASSFRYVFTLLIGALLLGNVQAAATHENLLKKVPWNGCGIALNSGLGLHNVLSGSPDMNSEFGIVTVTGGFNTSTSIANSDELPSTVNSTDCQTTFAGNGETLVFSVGSTDGTPGSLVIYEWANGSYEFSQILKPFDSQTTNQDLGGRWSIDSFGNTIVVGVRNAFGRVEHTGAAYVFTKETGGAWTQSAKLYASNGAVRDDFGSSVSISGTTIVVGAANDDDWGDNSGSVYVFELADGEWTQKMQLSPADNTSNRRFGGDVDISAGTIVASALGYGAYVFEKNENGNWQEKAELSRGLLQSGTAYGFSVSISGNNIAVGAFLDHSNRQSEQHSVGVVYIYSKVNQQWNQSAVIHKGSYTDHTYFGYQVELSGNTLAIQGLESSLRNKPGSLFVYNLDFDSQGWHSSDNWASPGLTLSVRAKDLLFEWASNFDGDTEVWVGSELGGKDIFDSGIWLGSPIRTVDRRDMHPTVSGAMYVRLRYKQAGSSSWDWVDYVYEAGPYRDWAESDSTSDSASEIVIGEVNHRTIHAGDDVDWTYFYLPRRAEIDLFTSGISGDTELFLYDIDMNRLSYDDDSGDGNFSRIGLELEAGTYYAKVQEYGQNDVMAYSLTLLSEPSVTAPTAISPAAGSAVPEYTPLMISFSAIDGVRRYHLQRFDRARRSWSYDNSNVRADVCNAGTCTVAVPGVAAQKNSIWRVRAYGSEGWGDWTPLIYFDVVKAQLPATPVAPSPLSPTAGSVVAANTTLTISFGSVEGVQRYQVQRYDRANRSWSYNNNNIRADVCEGGICTVEVPGMAAQTRAIWRVRAYGSEGWGDWTPLIYFDVVDALLPAKPEAPTPLSPTIESEVSANVPLAISFSAIDGVQRYHLQRFDRANRSWSYDNNNVKAASCAAGTCTVEVPGVAAQTRSIWRVRAYGSEDWSDWTPLMYFDVAANR